MNELILIFLTKSSLQEIIFESRVLVLATCQYC